MQHAPKPMAALPKNGFGGPRRTLLVVFRMNPTMDGNSMLRRSTVPLDVPKLALHSTPVDERQRLRPSSS